MTLSNYIHVKEPSIDTINTWPFIVDINTWPSIVNINTYRISCIFSCPKTPRPLLIHFRTRCNSIYKSFPQNQYTYKIHQKKTTQFKSLTNCHVQQFPRPHHHKKPINIIKHTLKHLVERSRRWLQEK